MSCHVLSLQLSRDRTEKWRVWLAEVPRPSQWAAQLELRWRGRTECCQKCRADQCGLPSPGAAVRALAALPEGAGNWGPPEGHLVAASCGEETVVLSTEASTSHPPFPENEVDCHLRGSGGNRCPTLTESWGSVAVACRQAGWERHLLGSSRCGPRRSL